MLTMRLKKQERGRARRGSEPANSGMASTDAELEADYVVHSTGADIMGAEASDDESGDFFGEMEDVLKNCF